MKRFNPIPDLTRLGYTVREAAFLYIVGANSGFFLARQYTRFLNRKPGAVLLQLIERGERLGHIRTLDWDRRWRLYHLHSRTIYRLLGQEESRNRHEKSSQEVLTRLMVLDYVLNRLPNEFCNGAADKQGLIARLMGTVEDQMRPIPGGMRDDFPIYLRSKSGPRSDVPQFTYFDYHASTLKAFTRYVSAYQGVWQALEEFDLTFVSTSERLMDSAHESFRRLFPADPQSNLLPLGREHLVKFLAAEQMWNTNDRRFSQFDLAVLKEGEQVYTRPEHRALRAAWGQGEAQFRATLRSHNNGFAASARFETVLLDGLYPVLDITRGRKREVVSTKDGFNRVSASISMASWGRG